MKRLNSVLVVLMLISNQVSAQEVKWDLIEVGGLRLEGLDSAGDFSPTGVFLYGSKKIGDSFFISGTYFAANDEEAEVDLELERGSLAVGYRYGISPSTDLYVSVGYEYADSDLAGTDFSWYEDNSGVGATGGIRTMVTSDIELGAYIRYIDIEDDNDNNFGFGISAYYYVTEEIALNAGYSKDDFFDSVQFGLRYTF